MGNSPGRPVDQDSVKVEGRKPLRPLPAAKMPAKLEKDEVQIFEMPQKRGMEPSGLPRKRLKLTNEDRTPPVWQNKNTQGATDCSFKGAGSVQANAQSQDVKTRTMQEGTCRCDSAAVDANAGFDDLMQNLQARVQSFKARESQLEKRLKAAQARAHEREGRSLDAEGRAHKMEGWAMKAEERVHDLEGQALILREREQKLEGRALKAEESVHELEARASNAEERVQEMKGRALKAEGRTQELVGRALRADERAQRSEERALKAEEKVVKLQAELEELRREKKRRPKVNIDMGKSVASIADLLILPEDQKRTPKAEAALDVPGTTAGIEGRSSAHLQSTPRADAQNQMGTVGGVQKIAPEKRQGTPKPAVRQAGTSADNIDHVGANGGLPVVGPQGVQGIRANVESTKVAGHNQQNEMLLQPHLMREGPGLLTEAQWTFLAKEARVFPFATIFGRYIHKNYELVKQFDSRVPLGSSLAEVIEGYNAWLVLNAPQSFRVGSQEFKEEAAQMPIPKQCKVTNQHKWISLQVFGKMLRLTHISYCRAKNGVRPNATYYSIHKKNFSEELP